MWISFLYIFALLSGIVAGVCIWKTEKGKSIFWPGLACATIIMNSLGFVLWAFNLILSLTGQGK